MSSSQSMLTPSLIKNSTCSVFPLFDAKRRPSSDNLAISIFRVDCLYGKGVWVLVVLLNDAWFVVVVSHDNDDVVTYDYCEKRSTIRQRFLIAAGVKVRQDTAVETKEIVQRKRMKRSFAI